MHEDVSKTGLPATLGERLRPHLEARREAGRYRSRITLDGPQGPRVRVDGREYLNFCSNDYLSLAADRRLVEALARGAAEYGVGSGASHLVSGHSRAHARLEEEIADWLGGERALLFSTGYMANLGVVAGLGGRSALVAEDRLNHASLLDAAILARARLVRYDHADAGAAARALAGVAGRPALLASDAVFSMDGDVAPLAGLAALAGPATLVIDDAHGIGVLGGGRGALAEAGLRPRGDIVLVGTFGKALGTAGAFVCADQAVIEALVQWARTYIYTTAMPPALAVASRASLAIVREESWRCERLAFLVGRFRRAARAAGIVLAPSNSAIQPLIVGDERAALAAAAGLREHGILAVAIRPPTVPEGTARLRLTLCAGHRDEDVDTLVAALADCPALVRPAAPAPL